MPYPYLRYRRIEEPRIRDGFLFCGESSDGGFSINKVTSAAGLGGAASLQAAHHILRLKARSGRRVQLEICPMRVIA